ncbi:heme ABC exporter ATP-binding protein CcmA [Palleronia sediminis]|uniref:Heme ABC exporter ATP-binding protein CcmA n=1 Tax=Palleronia sediminis TaxID=2547833 RepID=A0A4R6A7G8_9RHOB|nr:heme ABC exporter ATP-binding protein CcmA [Palleronia sediminis]TDL78128.1 heme ABC exporter ATP-binding protein CcmA [Palleronia sediminis]
MSAALSVRDLAVARGGLPVLSDLSFEIAPGHALVLRGPNGSGKTTLLRTLAGLQPPLRGTVAPGPGSIAYGAHANGMKGTLSVRENLTFWAGIHGQRDAVEDAMRRFALTALAERPAQGLSAGQGRRLGLARMVLTGRPVWLLDEPTVSLDAASVAGFADVLRGHLATGGAALVATHIDLGIDAPILDVGPYRATLADLDRAMGRDGGFAA